MRIAYTTDEVYPTTIDNGGGEISYSIVSDSTAKTYCITATGQGYKTKRVNQNGEYVDGPCEGASGGPSYCPDSYISINGYYCEGDEGQVPIGQYSSVGSHIIKLLASTSEVPFGAPGHFVGRQTERDVYSSASAFASSGEVFCVSGWASTSSSTVTHRIGVHFGRSGGGNLWSGTALTPSEATGVWKKVSGCFTAPGNATSVRLWTQNDAGFGSAGVRAPWYQTAIVLTKQS